MIVAVSANGEIALREPQNFRKFHVEIDAAPTALGSMRRSLSGRIDLVDDKTAWVPVSALQVFDGAPRDIEWITSLATMIEKARPHGWVRDEPLSIQAHLVWQAAAR